MIGRLGDTMCDLHRAQVDEKRGFLDLASKSTATVSPGFALKPVATISLILASKSVARVFQFGHQNWQL
jgi:hypothetical protein